METTDKILTKLLTKKKGTYVRFSMKSTVEGTALARKSAAYITKFTTTTARIGVNYANIKGVMPKGTLNKWYHWEVPNVVAVHNETGKKYISFATTPHSNTETMWVLNGEEVKAEDLVEMGFLTPAMAAKHHTPIIHVALNNIYRVK